MKQTKQTIIAIATLGLVLSCGVEDEKPENTSTVSKTEGNTTQGVSSDADLASEDISSQADSAIASTVNFEAGSTTALALVEEKGGVEAERDCEVDEAGNTVVTISREHTKEKTFTRKNIEREVNMTKSANITRSWKKEGTTIDCNEDKTRIALSPDQFEGAVLTVSFNREFAQSHKMTRGETTKSFNRSKSSEGTRTVTWLSSSLDGEIFTGKKSIVMDVKSTVTRLNKDGEDSENQFSLVTAEDAPLVVEVTREKGTKSWLKRTIVSGKTIGTNQDGGRIEITYDNAHFTKEAECDPVSGKVTGAIFEKDGTEALKSFEVDLAAETKTMTFSDGTTKEFELSGCAFAKPVKSVVKAIKKGQQKKREKVKRKTKK